MMGKELNFDNLSNITHSDEDNGECDLSTRSGADVSIFAKENYHVRPSKKHLKKVAPIAPSCSPEAEEKSISEGVESIKSPEILSELHSTADEKESAKDEDGEDSSTLTGSNSYVETVESPPKGAVNRIPSSRVQPIALSSLPKSMGEVGDDRFMTSRSTSIATDGPINDKRGINIRTVPSIESISGANDDDTHEDNYTDIVYSKARHDRADFVLDALQDDFDVNTRDRYGNTIFHICAQNNHKKLASTILKNFPQSQVSRPNKKGLTPLDYAEKYGFTVMAAWLRGKGARTGENWNTDR